jgi:2-phosphoglycerate kinase
MAKLLVINSEEGTKVPFLRGILTSSLQDIGLDFDEAYDLASDVRDSLSGEARIQTGELRKRVSERLRELHGGFLASRYDSLVASIDQVMICGSQGQCAPFSSDVHSKSMQTCGVTEDRARTLSRMLHRHLVARKRKEISSAYLGRLTYRILSREVDKNAAQRYLACRELDQKGTPLLILIGGSPGCGKSTIATALASRLDIFRTQSTDMLREVMRVLIPEALLPVLHRSSFDAWRALPDSVGSESDREDLIARGFRSQADLLNVACEAVVQRAVRERVSLVLEGVHMDATVMKRLHGDDVIVVPVMLAVIKQDLLHKRIRGRGGAVPHRRAERYLNNFDAIWQLQSYLLSEADKEQISIVVNEDKESTVNEILRIIADTLSARLKPTLKRVFPAGK